MSKLVSRSYKLDATRMGESGQTNQRSQHSKRSPNVDNEHVHIWRTPAETRHVGCLRPTIKEWKGLLMLRDVALWFRPTCCHICPSKKKRLCPLSDQPSSSSSANSVLWRKMIGPLWWLYCSHSWNWPILDKWTRWWSITPWVASTIPWSEYE